MYGSDPIEGRYSFSLTTFHPSGKLPQLSHATKASTIGPPVFAIHRQDSVVLVSVQNLPSPLIIDDGTARFVKVTDSILIGHTGINADGRVICDAAQRLAVEHSYTFEEEIPMSVLLEEMSLLFQEYTMKAGVRPFGCCVIVAGVNDDGGLYRVDPSGTVTKIDQIASLGKIDDESAVVESIREKMELMESEGCIDMDVLESILVEALRRGYSRDSQSRSQVGKSRSRNVPFISAKVTKGQDVSITRRWLTQDE